MSLGIGLTLLEFAMHLWFVICSSLLDHVGLLHIICGTPNYVALRPSNTLQKDQCCRFIQPERAQPPQVIPQHIRRRFVKNSIDSSIEYLPHDHTIGALKYSCKQGKHVDPRELQYQLEHAKIITNKLGYGVARGTPVRKVSQGKVIFFLKSDP
ncbi:hypothetical protein VNO77_43999 [Canavalia gladiata]|uniref:Uncharacterized protein n=1 Tax=Canavalia gladiata TaxID=3824 RepID=A0AAN9PPZ0_CANGL